MFLFVGLGNPGSEYKGNRHNTGFMAADELVRRYNFSSWRSRFNAETAEGEIGGEKVLLIKPQTFMNNSGESVYAAMSFYKLPVGNIVVFHDEMDVPVGKVKAKIGGGAGGHNGLRSIDSRCGTDYARVRIGIGHPADRSLVVPYVLSNFSKEEKNILETEFEDIAEAAPYLITGGPAEFTSRLAVIQSKKKKG